MSARLVDQILAALDEQTVVVPGSQAAETILPRLATALREVLHQRAQLAGEVEGMLDAHPLAGVLTSMPASGSGPPPGSCSKSATARPFPRLGTWPPMPAWPRSPAAPAARS